VDKDAFPDMMEVSFALLVVNINVSDLSRQLALIILDTRKIFKLIYLSDLHRVPVRRAVCMQCDNREARRNLLSSLF
jgi:hypothetical protein